MRTVAWLVIFGLAPLSLWAQDAEFAPEPFAPQVQFMTFGDVMYLATERSTADGFLLGQFVGHLNAGLTERVTVFSEVSATARPTGYAIEMERMILRYDFNDLLKVSGGRYHTPIGYWNTAYHHGAWLQTAVARPEMVKFGSRFVPVHFVGLLAEGRVSTPTVGVGYELGVGNGRGSVISRAGDAGDVNGDAAWVANLYVRPAALFGLQVGAGYYLDLITPESGPDSRERIVSAHLALQRERPELIAEHVRIFHQLVGSDAPVSSSSSFVQVGYRLQGSVRAVKPYARLERLAVGAGDPVFTASEMAYRAGLVGIRYDFAPFAALKTEYRLERFTTAENFHSLYVQASFVAPILSASGSSH